MWPWRQPESWRKGGRSYPEAQEGQTDCRNHNWYGITNFTNAGVSPRARLGPVFPGAQQSLLGTIHSDAGAAGLGDWEFGGKQPLLGFCGIQPHSNPHLLLHTGKFNSNYPYSLLVSIKMKWLRIKWFLPLVGKEFCELEVMASHCFRIKSPMCVCKAVRNLAPN